MGRRGVEGEAGLVVAELGEELGVRELGGFAQELDHFGVALGFAEVGEHLPKADHEGHDRIGQVVLGGGVVLEAARLAENVGLVLAGDRPEVGAGQRQEVGEVGEEHPGAGAAGGQGDDAGADGEDAKGQDAAPVDAPVFQLLTAGLDPVLDVQDACPGEPLLGFGDLLAADGGGLLRCEGKLEAFEVGDLTGEGLAQLVERQVAQQEAVGRLEEAEDQGAVVGQHLLVVGEVRNDVELAGQAEDVLVVEDLVDVGGRLHVLRVQLEHGAQLGEGKVEVGGRGRGAGIEGAVVVFGHAQAVGRPLVGQGLEQLEVAIFVHLGFLHGAGDAVWPLGAGEALGAVGTIATIGLAGTALAARTAGSAGATGAAGTTGDLEIGGGEAARDLVVDKDDGDVAAGAADPAAVRRSCRVRRGRRGRRA